MSLFASFLKSRRRSILDKNPLVDSFENIYFSGATWSLWKSARKLISDSAISTENILCNFYTNDQHHKIDKQILLGHLLSADN